MANSAFEALANLASLSRQTAMGLPAQVDAAPRWSGVGFSCMGFRFVVPMGQVSELMEVPATTRLPGVQSWVIGLANVRGRLLPLFDLARFVGGQISTQKKSHRVLVLETESLYSGLVVDRAFGMQHFVADTYGRFDGELPESLRQYIKGAYRDSGNEAWCVFDIEALSQDPNFTNASGT
ncbi:chemotaxis protein CheW [Agarilytica rhodophyticola]|uniref:chemotaxis protein CheW n=1 Tax=Agarilytica rhodophyticola TaxID=1737490 RepID=UPI000B348A25|nr:chemotaxis protein CheW [Agarilytica rhodophyticola]